jgi:hypothetical protein
VVCFRVACGRQEKGLDDFPAVIGVRSRSAGDVPQEVSGNDSFGRSAADASLSAFALLGYAARAHEAHPAAKTLAAEAALGLLRVQAVPNGW